MPAAASFQDLYQQATTCSSLSSSYHLPNYMNMFLASDSPKQQCPAPELQPSKPSLAGDKDQRHAHHNYQQQKLTNTKPTTTMVMAEPESCHNNSKHHQQRLTTQLSKIAPISYQQQQQQQRRPHHKEDLSRKHYAELDDDDDGNESSDYHYHDQYYHNDDDDLFNWQPHSDTDGFDLFDLDNMMIMHDDSNEMRPPHFLNTMTPPTMQHYLTLEELKSARNSCWLCGCNWQQDHVSLDCPECGGYALTRPCPSCDGKCQQVWMRNISNTHDRHKASWLGQCTLNNSTSNLAAATNPLAQAQSLACSQQPTPVAQVDATVRQATTTSAGGTTMTQDTTATLPAGGHLVGGAARTLQPPSPSSCCSSQPSSAASSDSE